MEREERESKEVVVYVRGGQLIERRGKNGGFCRAAQAYGKAVDNS